jgi:hypothetical protein
MLQFADAGLIRILAAGITYSPFPLSFFHYAICFFNAQRFVAKINH